MEIPNREFPWRRDITINGESTVELDFSGMHFAMLYATAGSSCPEDPYSHPDFESIPSGRKFLKVVLNAILNASTEHEVLGVVRREARGFDIDLPMSPTKLLSDLKKYHAPIADSFHTGEGLKLQRHDSHVMSNLLNWMREACLVGLPIHDSIVVELTYAEYVAERMRSEFYWAFNEEIELNNNIEIPLKPGCSWDDFHPDDVDPEWKREDLRRNRRKPNHGYRVRSQYPTLWTLESVRPEDRNVLHDVCEAKRDEIRANIRNGIAPPSENALEDLLIE